MSPNDVTVMLLSIGILLGAARLLGELMKWLGQPSVLGEIAAGILLGPTVLGAIAPSVTAYLFPPAGAPAVFLQGFGTVAVALFLLVAGLEVDLGAVRRQGRSAIVVSLSGIVIPFGLGFACATFAPRAMGREPGADPLIFALFFATALSISALPVIAKTLIDLGMFRSDLGMIIISAAIFEDLVGWLIFAVILGMMAASSTHALPVVWVIGLTLAFAAFMILVARRILHAVLPWIQAVASWPGGVLSFVAVLGLLCAALTELIGVHAIFGAFMAGVALGDSKHLHRKTRATLDQFVSFIFAPVFFASIGLRVNFVEKFHASLVFTVLVVACLGKVLGCGLGALVSGMKPRESLAVGFGMNARGAMEIVLGLLALQYDIIRGRLFVALVVTAIATSLVSGPLIQRLLRRKKARRLTDHLTHLVPLGSSSAAAAIASLCSAVAEAAGFAADRLEEAVMTRELMMPTGLKGGVAVPHARIEGLSAPLVAVGVSAEGIDFGALDGVPSRLVFLVLTPAGDPDVQLELLADISKTFSREDACHRALGVQSLTELIAVAKAEAPAEPTAHALASAEGKRTWARS